MARVVLVGVAHHLTQRGIDRRDVFLDEADYEIYLRMVRTSAQRYRTELLGYCLMPNHVHWIVVPLLVNSLAETFRDAHSRYSAYVNAKLSRNGHFWQNRFFSCPMDQAHLWSAMRYVERNPVRAHMVNCASAFRWSSAAVHTGLLPRPDWLEAKPIESAFSCDEWDVLLRSETMGEAEVELRKNTHTGRPIGSHEFVEQAEFSVGRKLAPQTGGRPPNSIAARASAGIEQIVLF